MANSKKRLIMLALHVVMFLIIGFILVLNMESIAATANSNPVVITIVLLVLIVATVFAHLNIFQKNQLSLNK
jgi:hypothetical protein